MTVHRPRTRLAAAVVAGLAAVLGGCVGPVDLGEPAEDVVADPYGLYDMLDYQDASEILISLETWGFEGVLSDGTLADLADRTVTEEEYQASFERHRSCMREAGYELENILMNGPFVYYETPGPAVDSGADDECYLAEFFATSLMWTDIHHEENERQNRLHLCTHEHGVDVSTESGRAPSMAEREQMLIEAGVDLEDC